MLSTAESPVSPALSTCKRAPYKLDIDVLPYMDETKTSEAKLISEFIKGVKKLGIWDNSLFISCRSSQNYGFGTGVKTFGGLAVSTATLYNSPIWGINGLTFDGLNDYLSTTLEVSSYTGGFAQMGVFNLDSTTPSDSFMFGDEGSGAGQGCGSVRYAASGGGLFCYISLTSGYTLATKSAVLDKWCSVSFRYTPPNNIFLSLDGGSDVVGNVVGSGSYSPLAPSSDTFGFGARNKAVSPALFAKMQFSFGCFIGHLVSAEIMEDLRQLYKNTLGQGLNLP